MMPLTTSPTETLALVSIIIPTYNEADAIVTLLKHLHHAGAATDAAVEIIVADGHSTDATAELARQAGARVLACPRKGRAAHQLRGPGRPRQHPVFPARRHAAARGLSTSHPGGRSGGLWLRLFPPGF
ncbi:glycosyltransferase [Hymenobacter humi]|uniref:Glycosyltransferase n=1 Tax=Hymenobacter humi TaxID=1411620 RepID=A0ABW2UB00_9BACT